MGEATNAEIRAYYDHIESPDFEADVSPDRLSYEAYTDRHEYMGLLLDRLEKAETKLEAITSYVSTDLFVRLRDLYQVGHDMFGDDLYEIITDLQEMLEKRDAS